MSALRSAYHALQLAGIDPRDTGHLRHLPRFLADLRAFRRAGGKVDAIDPVLRDYTDSAGAARGHYFHQDLLVAQYVHAAAPALHLDIASRIDGFVAHVAAFRRIEVLDIRPLADTGHPNIHFVQADLMEPQPELVGRYPSVSCLHALEHFGLGRYGDRIAPDGHLRGFAAMGQLVAPGGVFYLGIPVGRAQTVFNMHRIVDPADPPAWAPDEFALEAFDYVDDAGDLHRGAAPADARALTFGCGIYTLRRAGGPLV